MLDDEHDRLTKVRIAQGRTGHQEDALLDGRRDKVPLRPDRRNDQQRPDHHPRGDQPIPPYATPGGADNRTLETARTMIACSGLLMIR